MRDFSRLDLDTIIDNTLKIKRDGIPNKLTDIPVASLFFEASTRTRTSFETATRELGMKVHGFAGKEGTSVMKGEPLLDTVRMFLEYEDQIIIMRHNLNGAARFVADNIDVPVLNGGDGSANHPTQTMLDLVTIQEEFGRIDGLKIALVGDLKYGRTVHSLLQACELYDVEPWLVAPQNIMMPKWRIEDYQREVGKKLLITSDFMKAIETVDVLYMTRIQRERFPKGPEGDVDYAKVSGIFNLHAEMLKKAKPELIILHPLPRYKHNLEISMDVDCSPHAKYIQQAGNGLPTRQAVILKALGEGFEGRKKDYANNEVWQNIRVVNGAKKGEHFVYRINNGTLIDHIEPGRGPEVLKILGLQEDKDTTYILARNLRSKRYICKDVIGVPNIELNEYQLSRLGLVSSMATINIIRDNNVFKKGKVSLPPVLDRLVECQTTNCVSNPETHEFAPSKFYVESRNPLIARCHYCETPTTRKDLKLL